MLKLENIKLRYGYVEALKGLNIEIEKGTITSLLGANGAGKSSTLRAISGLNRIYEGKIIFEDIEIQEKGTDEIVKMGIIHCPEGRKLFPDLSVYENLLAGAYTQKNKSVIASKIKEMYELFPILCDRKKQMAGTLSGGEQQMLAIARALMGDPQILMLDEPSLGLAPKIVEDIFDRLVVLQKSGKTIFLVEQNANVALHVSDYAYILETGMVSLEGSGKELLRNSDIKKKYLGG